MVTHSPIHTRWCNPVKPIRVRLHLIINRLFSFEPPDTSLPHSYTRQDNGNSDKNKSNDKGDNDKKNDKDDKDKKGDKGEKDKKDDKGLLFYVRTHASHTITPRL